MAGGDPRILPGGDVVENTDNKPLPRGKPRVPSRPPSVISSQSTLQPGSFQHTLVQAYPKEIPLPCPGVYLLGHRKNRPLPRKAVLFLQGDIISPIAPSAFFIHFRHHLAVGGPIRQYVYAQQQSADQKYAQKPQASGDRQARYPPKVQLPPR